MNSVKGFGFLVMILGFILIAGCSEEDPISPVDTDYDFIIMNETGLELRVFRLGPLTEGEFLELGLIQVGEEHAYSSGIGYGYEMKFCLPENGVDEYEVHMMSVYLSNDDQHYSLKIRHKGP